MTIVERAQARRQGTAPPREPADRLEDDLALVRRVLVALAEALVVDGDEVPVWLEPELVAGALDTVASIATSVAHDLRAGSAVTSRGTSAQAAAGETGSDGLGRANVHARASRPISADRARAAAVAAHTAALRQATRPGEGAEQVTAYLSAVATGFGAQIDPETARFLAWMGHGDRDSTAGLCGLLALVAARARQ